MGSEARQKNMEKLNRAKKTRGDGRRGAGSASEEDGGYLCCSKVPDST